MTVHEMLWLTMLFLVFASLTLSHLGPGLILLIIVNYLSATMIAIVCNELRRHFTSNRETGNLPPIGRYLLPGALTFIVATFATLTFLTVSPDDHLLQGRPSAMEAYLEIHWPWMLLHVFVAIAIAFLIGDWLAARRPKWHRRLDWYRVFNPADGAVVALGLALVSAFFVHPSFPPEVAEALNLPTAKVLALRTAVFGFILGGFAPVRYRSSLAREEAFGETRDVAVSAGRP